MLLFPYKCLGNDIFEGPQPVDHPGFIIYPGTRTGLAGGGAPNTNLRPVQNLRPGRRDVATSWRVWYQRQSGLAKGGVILLDPQGSVAPLSLASLLLLATAVDARRDRYRPLWLRLVVRIIAFATLTWLMQFAVGSPVAPQFPAAVPGEAIWAQLAEIGWWMVGARVAVGALRLVVVLENRPRETQIVSDLLAGAIYITTALAVVNFAFGVPIAGLVATSGVVAIVLGLALQSTLSDVFSGIAVGLEHAYKPGDLLWVEGGIEGQVLQINWRSTQIATPQNSIAIVPNSVIAKSRLENRSAPTPTRGVTVSLSTDAAIDPRRCIMALDAAVHACMLPLTQPKPSVGCVGLQGDGIAYDIRFSVGATAEIAAARTEMLSQVTPAFAACRDCSRRQRHSATAVGVSANDLRVDGRIGTFRSVKSQ